MTYLVGLSPIQALCFTLLHTLYQYIHNVKAQLCEICKINLVHAQTMPRQLILCFYFTNKTKSPENQGESRGRSRGKQLNVLLE